MWSRPAQRLESGCLQPAAQLVVPRHDDQCLHLLLIATSIDATFRLAEPERALSRCKTLHGEVAIVATREPRRDDRDPIVHRHERHDSGVHASAAADDDITSLLKAWGAGDADAGDELLERVAARLQTLAASFLRRERHDHTLQTTELIHEAYIRIVDQRHIAWHHRDHFFAIVGRMMRRILVDHARRRELAKHGGAWTRLPEEAVAELSVVDHDPQLTALDEALDALERQSSDLARIVELRYFVGLTGEEIAACLGISTPTVQRRWQAARAWLYRYLNVRDEASSDAPLHDGVV